MLLLRGSCILLFHICRSVVLRKTSTSWKYCDMEKEIKTWSFCFRRRRDEPQEKVSFSMCLCVFCVWLCERERERERGERERRERVAPFLRAYVRFHIRTMLRIELLIFSLPKLYNHISCSQHRNSSTFCVMLFV